MQCRFPLCGKEIRFGKYCNDDCYRNHRAELNRVLIKGPVYDLTDISIENLGRWS